MSECHTKCWNSSTIDKINYYYKTTIDNFLALDTELISDTFMASFNTVWSFMVKPNKQIDGKQCVAVYASMVSDNITMQLFKIKLIADVSVYVMRESDTDGHNNNDNTISYGDVCGAAVCFGRNEVFVDVYKNGTRFLYFEFVRDRQTILDKTNRLLSADGKLSIVCKIVFNVSIGESKFVAPIDGKQLASGDKQINNNSDKKLLAFNNSLTEITLIINSKEITAYKELLVISPRFANIFADSDVKEYVIRDIYNEDVFYTMLKYIYQRKVDNIDNIAEELLIAANKYLLDSLKDECERALVRQLSADNACHLLMMANNNNANALMDKCLVFVAENLKSMRQTKDWRTNLIAILKVAKKYIDKRIQTFKTSNEQFKRCVDAIQKLDK